MNNLNARQIEFINLLLNEKDYRTIKWYSEMLSVSDKTLKKDLMVIEDYLNKFNIRLNRKHSLGVMIEDVWNAKLIIQNNLHIQEDKDPKISVNDRRIDIIKTMLMDSHNKTSIQKLSDKYYVSKTSIINDFKYIEEWLFSFDLALEKTVEGTQVIGDEMNIRRAIASFLFEYSKAGRNDRTIEELVTRLDGVTLNGLSELFENDKIIYVNRLLLDLEKKYSCIIDDPYYINLLTHMLISMERGAKGKSKFSKDKVQNLKYKKEYEEATLCISKINKDFNMNLDEAEVYYLYKYFVSFGLIKEEISEDYKDLDKFSSMTISFRDIVTESLEKILNVNIRQDSKIMEKLLLHIRAMLNRIEYDIQISNPLIKDIKTQYPLLLNVCKASSMMASFKLKQKEIPIDEIGYLALYYQLGLESYHIKKKVLIVCHSGYGTSKLLSTKLKRYFPDFEIVESISSERIKSQNIQNIDLIITTVPLDLKDKPCLLVSAFLSEKDIKNISDFLSNIKEVKGEISTKTPYIGSYLCEDFIYFNKSEKEVISSIKKGLKREFKFNEIDISDNLKIYISFCEKEDKLALCINDIEKDKKQLVFYILMDNVEVMTEILKEVVNFNINDDYGSYLRKCIKKKDAVKFFKLNGKGEMKMEVDLSKVIRKETIKLDMKAATKDEALKELTDLLYETDVISDKKAFLDDVYYRETLGSTGIGNGIAIPHGKSQFVSRTSIAFGKTKNDLVWETLDDKPVNFVILFAVTEEDKTSTHVRLLSKVATKLGDDEACEALLKANTPEEVYEIFTKQEEVI